MLLPDFQIEELCSGYEPLIEPFDSDQLQPASYDLRLSSEFCFPGPNNVSFYTERIAIPPGKFVLGCTAERLTLPNWIAAQVDGKSGNARRGIQIEAAGHVDPGYRGVITLEIANFGDETIRLHQGMGIAKVLFILLREPCLVPYSERRNAHQFASGPSPR